MEANGYLMVNREKTIFMKHDGKHIITHGLFVDDMMHIATNNKLKNEFMEKYSRDFNITGEGFIETFLGMEIEQSNRLIKHHVDHYVHEMLKGMHQEIATTQESRCFNLTWSHSLTRGYPHSPGPIQTQVLQVICCQASICGFVDSL